MAHEIIIRKSPRGYCVQFPYRPNENAIRGFHGIKMTWDKSAARVAWFIPTENLEEAIGFIKYWYEEHPLPGQQPQAVRVEDEVAMIVTLKVQIPLATNAPEPLALIYSEDHAIDFQPPVTPDLLSWFAPGEARIFIEAEYDETTGDARFVKKLPDQGW